MKLLRRNRWPVVVGGLYDIRECPHCAALVYGDEGQRRHGEAHEQLDEDLFGPEITDPGGYVIGAGPLPASVRGGADDE